MGLHAVNMGCNVVAYQKNNQKYVIMDYKEKNGKIKQYEIDCNLSMFMKLIGKEYKSWNQMMMTESVKNGNKVN